MNNGLTFGIMTIYDDIPRLNAVIESIKALKIPHVEVLVAGSYNNYEPWKVDPIAQHVCSNGWLPQKKNLVAKMAQHETLCLLHDYFLFDGDWFLRWLAFNEHMTWDVASNAQFLINGKRHFTDWVLWDHPHLPRYHSLDYQDWSKTKYQYISGQFFLVNRDFLRQNPLNEAMPPGSPEDVEWSLRIRDKAVMCCNGLAKVRHNKVHRDCK